MEVESFLLVIPTMFHWKPQPEAKVKSSQVDTFIKKYI